MFSTLLYVHRGFGPLWVRNLGDVNGDGEVSLSDITLLVNRMLTGSTPSNFVKTNADVTCDGEMSISDVMEIVGKVLGQ